MIHISAGIVNITDEDITTKYYVDPNRIFIHPKRDATTRSYDLAVLTVTRPFQFSRNVNYICLASPEDHLHENTTVGLKFNFDKSYFMSFALVCRFWHLDLGKHLQGEMEKILKI